ncbi:4'-phosphopantetheinyl transferase family protein [Chitinilyticum aquatile]|uniref:4'-phosphopantetheinyl transferase family protein n=1 Tax=Chitinilyticum aquatile TaxID=362520 RepID=UPI0004218D1A|nr:4'-phosphopantetheinyl transferase superfamily protein [Chitinilyticum aquatile]
MATTDIPVFWLHMPAAMPLPADLALRLSASSQGRLAGMTHASRALQFVLGRLLLLHAARALLAPDLRLADLAEHADGYPVLPDYPVCRASISHSGTVLAVALNPAGACGLDIEAEQPRNYARLARKFCPADERWLAEADDEPDARTRFYTLWTLREAAYKGGWRAHVVGEPPALSGDAGPLPAWDTTQLAPDLRATLVWPQPCRIAPCAVTAAALAV